MKINMNKMNKIVIFIDFRLAALNRELKAKELNLMDATRRKFLQHQQQTKEAEIARMDDEIKRKVNNNG